MTNSDLQQKQRDYLNTPEGLDEVLRHFAAYGVTRPGKSGLDDSDKHWKALISMLQTIRDGDEVWLDETCFIDIADTLKQMTSDYSRTVLGVQIITDRSGGDE